MSVRCKFKVVSVSRAMGSVTKRNEDGSIVTDQAGRVSYEHGEVWTVKMAPVYANGDPKHENSLFWAAIPGGTFELNCVNKAAVEKLILDSEYYIDIIPAK
jgi:hypothetical protein